MAIVLPNGILQNVSNGSIRYWIRLQAQGMGVVTSIQATETIYMIPNSELNSRLDAQHCSAGSQRMAEVDYER